MGSAQRPGRKRVSDYKAPPHVHAITLSEALRGTGRFPEAQQLGFARDIDSRDGRHDISIYYAGELSLLRKPCVAIVGTRQVSQAGLKRTKRLARELVDAGVVVVSGLAAGVDSAAHTAAIESCGQTIAVIGTPLSKAYPAQNARLQETIYREHLLVSQFALHERTFPSSFPQRNKLMAVLSDATVIIEASDTSGTLHQAAECTRLGRWLFIAKSVVENQSLAWPRKFLRYDTCLPLEDASDITNRILR